MADNQIEVEILARLDKAEKDIKGFAEKSEGLLKNILFGVNVAAFQASLGIAKEIFETTKAILEKPIEMVLEGEKLRMIEGQFEMLSEQAGQIGTSLEASLVKAGGGLADTNSILLASNRAFIQLGENASRLPETLELARKTALVFGGDVVENFEKINQAIASGSVKQLRGLGLKFDLTKAEKDYAASIGKTVSELNEAGRQHAILNAVLETGGAKYKNVTGDANKSTVAWQQMTVAITEAHDASVKLFSLRFGDKITQIAQELTLFFKSMSGQKLTIQDQLNDVNNQLKQIQGSGWAFMFGGRIEKLTQQATVLKKQLEDVNKEAANTPIAGATKGDPNKETDAAAVEAKAIKLAEFQNKITNDLLAAELERATIEDDVAAQDKIRSDQRNQYSIEMETKRQAALKQLKDMGINDEKIRQSVLDQLEETEETRLQSMRQSAQVTAQAVASAWKQGIANTVASGMQQIIGNLVAGKNAFQDFGKVILGMLGGLAVQMGTMILAAGIAKSTLITDLFGGPTIVAGLTLIAVGSLLQAFAGGGTTDTGGGVSSGGGGYSSPASAATVAPKVMAQPGTAVNINIQGNVLDRRAFGLEIADTLQEYFNNNGNLVVGGGF